MVESSKQTFPSHWAVSKVRLFLVFLLKLIYEVDLLHSLSCYSFVTSSSITSRRILVKQNMVLQVHAERLKVEWQRNLEKVLLSFFPLFSTRFDYPRSRISWTIWLSCHCHQIEKMMLYQIFYYFKEHFNKIKLGFASRYGSIASLVT